MHQIVEAQWGGGEVEFCMDRVGWGQKLIFGDLLTFVHPLDFPLLSCVTSNSSTRRRETNSTFRFHTFYLFKHKA